MQKLILTFALALLMPLLAGAEETRVYRWVDDTGQVHFGDSIPVEYSELPKQVLNERGITIGLLAGKKSEEQIAAEQIEEQRRITVALQQRADQALLATYLTVEEILMHRDRRVELFQAQSRVTELYLNNLSRRLDNLRGEASNFLPYSENPDAPMIAVDLADDLRVTKETIARHERNLRKFQADEQLIVSRFDGDISRFKLLKGIE